MVVERAVASRRGSRPAPPRPAGYFDRPGPRLRWLHELRQAGLDARVLRPGPALRGHFVLRLVLRPAGLEPVVATLALPSRRPDAVKVTATGPADSPHRYADGSLCMWHPHDGPDRRWCHSRGPVVLVGHVLTHLMREEFYRRTGEWLGEQAPHTPPTTAARRAA